MLKLERMFSLSKRASVKRLTTVAVILPTLALFISSFIWTSSVELKIGKKVPMMDSKMTGIDGKNLSLTDAMGEKGLLVVFSCNTCPFVVGSSKFDGWEVQYNDLHKMAKANGLEMVLINSNEAKRGNDDSMNEMKNRALEKGYTMPYLVDEGSALADAFGAKTTPHLFILAPDGKLLFRGSIDNSWDSNRKTDENYAQDAITALGQNKKLKTKTSEPRGCSIKRAK